MGTSARLTWGEQSRPASASLPGTPSSSLELFYPPRHRDHPHHSAGSDATQTKSTNATLKPGSTPRTACVPQRYYTRCKPIHRHGARAVSDTPPPAHHTGDAALTRKATLEQTHAPTYMAHHSAAPRHTAIRGIHHTTPHRWTAPLSGNRGAATTKLLETNTRHSVRRQNTPHTPTAHAIQINESTDTDDKRPADGTTCKRHPDNAVVHHTATEAAGSSLPTKATTLPMTTRT